MYICLHTYTFGASLVEWYCAVQSSGISILDEVTHHHDIRELTANYTAHAPLGTRNIDVFDEVTTSFGNIIMLMQCIYPS